MLVTLDVLKEVSLKLYPYFVPSWRNCSRALGLTAAVIIVPSANFIILKFLFAKGGNSETDYFDVINALATASTIALISGVQGSLSTLLSNSTMQEMKKQNIQLLMDELNF